MMLLRTPLIFRRYFTLMSDFPMPPAAYAADVDYIYLLLFPAIDDA